MGNDEPSSAKQRARKNAQPAAMSKLMNDAVPCWRNRTEPVMKTDAVGVINETVIARLPVSPIDRLKVWRGLLPDTSHLASIVEVDICGLYLPVTFGSIGKIGKPEGRVVCSVTAESR
jgi:hypothetical protein